MISNNEANAGHFLPGFEVGDQVQVALHYQRESGDPSAEWMLSEKFSFIGTVVEPPDLRSMLYGDSEIPRGSINVMPNDDSPQPVARPKNEFQSSHPRLVSPGEWYEKLDGQKILLRRSVTLLKPGDE